MSSEEPIPDVDAVRAMVESQMERDKLTEADFALLINEPASKLRRFMQSKPDTGHGTAVYKALVAYFERETHGAKDINEPITDTANKRQFNKENVKENEKADNDAVKLTTKAELRGGSTVQHNA